MSDIPYLNGYALIDYQGATRGTLQSHRLVKPKYIID